MDAFCLSFCVAIATTLVLTPAAARLARLRRIVDVPGGRKTHSRLTPLLGGLSIFLGAAIPTAFFLLHAGAAASGGRPWLVAAAGAVLVLCLGIWDDARDLRPRRKLAAQLAIALLVGVAGARVAAIDLPGSVRLGLGVASLPLTVLWITASMNAWNLIDGMDGLAAGLAALAAGLLGWRAAAAGEMACAVLYLSLAGACLAFLRHNFHPASIFMGDCGSLFLGYVFAVGPLMAGQRVAGHGATGYGATGYGAAGYAATGYAGEGAALDAAIPMLILLLPIADMTAAVVRRARLFARVRAAWGMPTWDVIRMVGAADRRHVHHLLLARGLGQRRAAIALYGVALLLGGVAMARGPIAFQWAALAAGPLALGIFLLRLGCATPGSASRARAATAPGAPIAATPPPMAGLRRPRPRQPRPHQPDERRSAA